jgi:hypothetical protein
MLSKTGLEIIEGKYGYDKVLEDAQYEAFEAAQTALAYRSMLERLEWVEVGEREGKNEMIPAILCPSCDNWKEEGHKPDCELAALLRRGEG